MPSLRRVTVISLCHKNSNGTPTVPELAAPIKAGPGVLPNTSSREPDLEWALVSEAQRFVSTFWQDCNDLQALEGGVDPAHTSFLHGTLDARDDALRRAPDQAPIGRGFTSQLERAPHIEVADTETGLLIGARRDAPAGQH